MQDAANAKSRATERAEKGEPMTRAKAEEVATSLFPRRTRMRSLLRSFRLSRMSGRRPGMP